MANYWAITIGINQYRHFQPLMHAQDDALLLHRFFTQEACIPEDHCVLLSDLTTSVTERAVYPDKSAIAQWIQTLSQQIEEGDTLWFFFSGYGAQVDGKDYLMPIDGDSDSAASTGMAAADLIETLAKLPTENAVLILDINRSQGALAGQTIGSESIDLAEKHRITTFLSCQPEQYSHETLGVRHGLFTAALLEAIHQDRKTPAQISEYLNKRIPELCEHHWRPIQNPVAVVAEPKESSAIVPNVQNTLLADADLAVGDASYEGDYEDDYEGDYAASRAVTSDLSVGTAVATVGSTALATGRSSEVSSDGGRPSLGAIQPPYTEETIATGSYRAQSDLKSKATQSDGAGRDLSRKQYDSSDEDTMAVTGAKLRNWGLLALALLMGGVLLKQPFVQTAWEELGERISGTENVDAIPSESEEAPESERLEPETQEAGGETSAAPTQASPDSDSSAVDSAQVDAAAAVVKPAATDTEQADSEATASAAVKTPAAETPNIADATVEEKAATQALIAQANTAIEQRQYSEALIALQQVPRSQRDSTFSAVLTKARTGAAEAKQTNRSTLTEARTSIQPTQASQFTEAINKARLIQPGEPFYEEAQRDIRSWSQVILDIAEGRATGGSLESAIAAANVMPRDNAELYQKAQDRIAFWQQRQNSRTTIAEAQTIPKLGQASTYQKGIVKLREVPIEHPEYETAQRLADQWSQSIFSIAQARAAQGRQNAAVQAAILVPAGTTAYEPTQQAIRRWKSEE